MFFFKFHTKHIGLRHCCNRGEKLTEIVGTVVYEFFEFVLRPVSDLATLFFFSSRKRSTKLLKNQIYVVG